MSSEIRVRFAPSPTGALHIGGVRTALYNYLFARKNGGKFILRIEDTDQTRFVEGAEDYIRQSLEWLGIETDEDPWQGGEYGPYRQSERKSMYMQYAQQLVDNGYAYYAFDTSEELDAMRERLKAARVKTPQYNAITRETMRNSLTLPDDEVKALIENGTPYVIRLKVPRKEEVRLKDMVRGWVMVHSSTLDDKVIMKSDGMPTYHLANIVDDHLMKITHVIRGEEWLPSAPIHVLLYKYLGWEGEIPQMAHLPLILKPDGNGKLSKRAADKLGFPAFPLEGSFPNAEGQMEKFMGFRESGYLPEAVLNFLSFLGWNPGTEEELFSKQELIDAFTVERIGKSGTKFDIDKARWFNQQYMKQKSDRELADMLLDTLKEQGISCTQERAERIASLMKERIVFPADFWKEGAFFFKAPQSYDEKVVRKKWNEHVARCFLAYKEALKSLEDYNADTAKQTLVSVLEEHDMKMGQVMQALRVAVTGAAGGPELMDVLEVLGKQEVIQRLEKAVNTLSSDVKA